MSENNNHDNSGYEEVCAVCRRTESVAGKMVKLQEGLASIGDMAFLGCRGMTEIILPKSLEDIGEHVIDKHQAWKTIVYSGSYAEKYCKENGLDYTVIDTGA